MVKDEELLLVNMEQGSNSDSDEVVEEFKLPPKQPKRSRKKRLVSFLNVKNEFYINFIVTQTFFPRSAYTISGVK